MWDYTVIDKNLHRRARRAPVVRKIGPQALMILRPLLVGLEPDELVWRFPPNARGQRTPISRHHYARFLKLACKAAGVEPWHPHQIRHTRGTEIRDRYESDKVAAIAIGDTEKVLREIYADPSDEVAYRVALATG